VGIWGVGCGGLSLGKFNISMSLLPVTSLHTPVSLKVILGFKKQRTNAEFWCQSTPHIRVTYNSHQIKM